MKQVWQATDGTIFEKEIDCEKYEDKLAYEATLAEILREDTELLEHDTYLFLDIVKDLTRLGHASKLINFIKSIGEQDEN